MGIISGRGFTLGALRWLLIALQGSVIALCIAFEDRVHPMVLLGVVAAYFLATLLIDRVTTRCAEALERRYTPIVAGFLLLMLAANIAAGLTLRYNPLFDLGAIYHGAILWAKTGTFAGLAGTAAAVPEEYFYYFPNNLGGMALLFAAFKAAGLLGISDYFAIATVTNALLGTCAVGITILICSELFGKQKSLMALAVFALYPPLYLFGAAFYTDFLSILFPVLSLWLYIKYARAETGRAKLLLAAGIGLACGIGMLIKQTVLITLVAICIYELLCRPAKEFLRLAAASVAALMLAVCAFNLHMDSRHIDRELARELNTPLMHWVYMSSHGLGAYDMDDYAYTRSLGADENKNWVLLKRTVERIADQGLEEYLSVLRRKEVKAFGEGTLSQSDFFDDRPVYDTPLHGIALYQGEFYSIYRCVATGAFLAMQALMLLGVIRSHWRGGKEWIIPQLCILGAIMFFALWEASSRYITNMVPMIVISAVHGLCMLRRLSKTQGEAARR